MEAEVVAAPEEVVEVEEAYSELNPVFVEQQAQAAVPPGPEVVVAEPSVVLVLALPVGLFADFHHPELEEVVHLALALPVVLSALFHHHP